MTIIVIPDAFMVYSSIYQSRTFDATPKFSSAFRIDSNVLQSKLADLGYVPRPKDGLFTTNSKFSPLVTAKNESYDYLVRALEIADARNMGRDLLFKNRYVDIVIDIFDYEVKERGCPVVKGIGAALTEVTVDANAIYNEALKYKKQGELK